ncbi:MAG: hypothetical protein K5773_08195 [Pseudobutyrivibrio sp.]|nr:hypothetical protein [Pseudobutyrivibrio sp.]
MKRSKIAKVLSLALATVIATSAFSFTSFAKVHADAETQKRALTAEEIQTIYTLFDADFYAKANQDVVKVVGDDPMALYTHFVTFGIWEERMPSDGFNVSAFASRNYDLQPVLGDDIVAWYMYYCTHSNEWASRPIPSLYAAYRANTDVYSVYDFVKGQTGPEKGAYPIQTYNYTPMLDRSRL